MSPDNIANCFETLVKHNAITQSDFVFENHFLVLFWRRNKWFLAKNYPKIVRGLYQLNYNDHVEFWEVFLDQIPTMTKYLEEANTLELLQAVEDVNQFEKIDCSKALEFLREHLVFC